MNNLTKDILRLAEDLEVFRPELLEISISALDKNSFFINSADSNTRQISKQDIGEYRLEPILAITQSDYLSKSQIEQIISDAAIANPAQKIPWEALIHAISLKLADAKYVMHSHSKTVNKIICSKIGSQAFQGHVFEESVIVCGKNPARIQFAESGYALAMAIYKELSSFQKIHFHLPKILLLENHGVLIMAQNPQELLDINKTLELWAELLFAGYQLGGPNYLSLDHIMAIEAEFHKTGKQ